MPTAGGGNRRPTKRAASGPPRQVGTRVRRGKVHVADDEHEGVPPRERRVAAHALEERQLVGIELGVLLWERNEELVEVRLEVGEGRGDAPIARSSFGGSGSLRGASPPSTHSDLASRVAARFERASSAAGSVRSSGAGVPMTIVVS